MPTIALIAVAAILVVAIVTTIFALRQKTSRKLSALSAMASEALQEIETLSSLEHDFTVQEATAFRTKYEVTYNEAAALRDNRFLSQAKFDESSLPPFMAAYNSIEQEQRTNQHHRESLKVIVGDIEQVAFLLKQYLDADHYFAFSEAKHLQDTYAGFFSNFQAIYNRQPDLLSNREAADYIAKSTRDLEATRKQHNTQFIAKEKEQHTNFFDTVLEYPLDPQQRDAIVKLEDNTLVISSAGSGKTSTIVGKTKYLVDIRQTDPQDILLVTYTKKAAEELSERMSIPGLTCSTFHSLAYRIIADATDRKPSICDNALMLNAFRDLMASSPEFVAAIDEYIINLQSLMKWQHEYTDAVEYYADRKKYGIQSLFPDMDVSRSPSRRKRNAFARTSQRWGYATAMKSHTPTLLPQRITNSISLTSRSTFLRLMATDVSIWSTSALTSVEMYRNGLAQRNRVDG